MQIQMLLLSKHHHNWKEIIDIVSKTINGKSRRKVPSSPETCLLNSLCFPCLKYCGGSYYKFFWGFHFFRYGDMFSTTIMGRTIVCVSNPEAIKFVLSTAHSSFPEGFGTQHFRLTSQGVFRGPGHPHFRRIILQDTTGESLQRTLPFISSTAKKVVDEWENKESVHVCSEMNKVVNYLLQVFSHLFSYLFESYSDVESQVAI